MATKRANASSSVGAAARGATAKKRKLATHSPSSASTRRKYGDKAAGPVHNEEKEDHVAVTQRHLAQRLEQAARVREGSHTVRVQLRRQRRRMVAVVAPVASARRQALHAKLGVLMEMAAQLRLQLLQQRARLEPRPLMRVWRRLDDMTARAEKIRAMEQRVQFVTRRMQKIVVRASKIGERRRLKPTKTIADTEHNAKESNTGLVTDLESIEHEEAEEEDRRPLPVELAPHQWMPPILWTIYESIERVCRRKNHAMIAAAMNTNRSLVAPREELRAAMQQLMEQMRDINPYSHLHVLYRPPPPALAGEWQVKQSMSVRRIAESLSHYFSQLHRTAFWLESPLSETESAFDCGRRFLDLIGLVRSLSTHFHYVVLYLYSVAMGRADLNATASSIARQAATHSIRIDVREAYGLSPSLLVTSDSLLRQTYSYFPEVLVFLDEWRREESFRVFGFDSNEAASEFVVDFYRAERKDQRTLVEIATYLKDIFHAWRRSKLGTSSFEKMQISDIGALEQLVKGRLRLIVDLLYTQNIAAWFEWKQRSDHHTSRVFNELRIMASPRKRVVEVAPEEESRRQHQDQQEAPRTHSEPERSKHKCHVAEQKGEEKPEIGKKTLLPPKQNDAKETEKVAGIKTETEDSPATQNEAKEEAGVVATEAGATPSAVRRLKQQYPNKCGRFRAPGVLNLNEQRIATESAKSKKSTHKKQEEPRADPASDAAGTEDKNVKAERDLKSQLSMHASLKSTTRKDDIDGDEKPVSNECESRYYGSVLLKDIYAWTDEQIDAHEQEKEHIYELQQQLLLLRDKMSLETAMQFTINSYNARSIPKKARSSIALVEVWSQIREFARAAVCHSETIALHGAAEALIQRPSLRLDQSDAVCREELEELKESSDTPGDSKTSVIVIDGDDDEVSEPEKSDTKTDPQTKAMSTEELEKEVLSLQELKETIGSSRHTITELLKSYNGDQTKEWHNHLVFFAQASQNLLEIAHDRVLSAVHVEPQNVST